VTNKLERFTYRARLVLSFAQQSAEQLNHRAIGAEHLLLALAHVEDSVAGRALKELSLSEIKIEELIQRMSRAESDSSSPITNPQLGADTKCILELAVDEAHHMGHHYIGTEHLLLGLVRLREGVAIDILKQLGISPEEVRRQTRRVLQILQDMPQHTIAPLAATQLNASTKAERFTERARRVLSLAQEEAERFQHNYIGTEHLLLGLIREEGGVAGRVLRELGLDQRRVEELVKRMTRASPRTTTIAPELSPGTKRVLELAVDEARRMGHHYIGTEHLLLGLVRLPEGVAIDILKRLGISPEEVRRQTRRVLQENINPPQIATPTSHSGSLMGFTQRARRVLALAQNEAERLEHQHIGIEHLLLGMIIEEEGVAGQVLRALELDQSRVVAIITQLSHVKREEHVPTELSDGSKRVLELAADEARRMKYDYIDTEHLLLGLVRIPASRATDSLKALGTSVEEVRQAAQRVLQESTKSPILATAPEQPASSESERFTQRARRILSHAQAEAERLEHNHIGTEHLLLGMIIEEGGVAGRVLRNLGVDQTRVEQRVIGLTHVKREANAVPNLAESTKRVLELGVDEARRMGHHHVGTEHLLLGLVRMPSSRAIDILKGLGISPEEVTRQTRRVLQEVPVVPRSDESATKLPRVFIGCAKEDRQVAEWLIYGLAAQQVTSWTDSVSMLSGKGWETLSSILLQSDVFVIVLSPNALADKQLAKERLFFADILERPIIPVLWQDCEIDPALEKLGVIDLRGQREEGIKELVAAIQKHLST
jgi:ATP-dependent Clp protease ATP-binding subunit ClpA